MVEGDIRKDRKPLFEKLEPSHHSSRRAFQGEAVEWSKGLRGAFKAIWDFFMGFWNA